ncbi:hypothetical protein ACWF94_39955 [Streptomyces sp. NPDC055078]
MTQPTRRTRRTAALDTLRAATGFEAVLQRRAAQTLCAVLRGRVVQMAITPCNLHTEVRWQGPGSVDGHLLIHRRDGNTVVDVTVLGMGGEAADALARLAGTTQGTPVGTDEAGQRVLRLCGHSVTEARRILDALIRATEPSPLQITRARYSTVRSELLAALEHELTRRVLADFPGAGWLVVDPGRWSDTWGESQIELRAVIACDGHVLHEHEPCRNGARQVGGLHHTQWAEAVDQLLTDTADLDGIAGWPEVCDVITWACYLRAVRVSTSAAAANCRYLHDDHDVDQA